MSLTAHEKTTAAEAGHRVRMRREELGMSQLMLAKAVGISQTTVQKIDTGESASSRFMPIIWAKLKLPLNELNPIFGNDDTSTQDVPNQPNSFDSQDQGYSGGQVVELLRVAMARETHIKAVDVAFSRTVERDGGQVGVTMTVFRTDGTTLQIFLGARQAEFAVQEIPKLLARSHDREP
jgi:DNA-binding XRE family transcriptional regulator